MTSDLNESKKIKFYVAIIDGDPLLYKAGFSVERLDKETGIVYAEELRNAISNLRNMIRSIKSKTGADRSIIYVTKPGDKTNYRYKVYPQYKANRKEARRPIYFEELRRYLIEEQQAKDIESQEADDATSIHHCLLSSPDGYNGFIEENLNSVLCSVDKDLDNTPGWHFNYGQNRTYFVSEDKARRNFYLQMMTGDIVDGIPRIRKGWRKKETQKLLDKAKTDTEMKEIIFNEIALIKYPDKELKSLTAADKCEIINEINWRGRLVWIRRNPEELWAYES